MSRIVKIANVIDYNRLYSQPGSHPMINVVDLSAAQPRRHTRMYFGFYGIFLKEGAGDEIRYGLDEADYRAATLLCVRPGQIIGLEDTGKPYQPEGRGVIFHAGLARGTALGKLMRGYSFFSYELTEALHLSGREAGLIRESFEAVRNQLEGGVSKHTKRIVARELQGLLEYCRRFYNRQFLTRSDTNRRLCTRFGEELDAYFVNRLPLSEGLPTVRFFAERMHLSAAYLQDVIEEGTGLPAGEYISRKLLGLAQHRLVHSEKTVTLIAYELGFKCPQDFIRFFQQRTGYTPKVYRQRQYP
ncbi:MAG: helix-turn-helix domain-containing protein [Parabacteroides sp.]|nr:helix-turn-helix domain-containing protein [Parabacteroides sp.]